MASVEVNARIGLLIRAIDTYGNCYTVIKKVVHELKTEVSRHRTGEYVQAFLGADTVQRLFHALHVYSDHVAFVVTGMELMILLFDGTTFSPSLKEFLELSSGLEQCMATSSHASSALPYLHILRMCIVKNDENLPADWEIVVNIVTQIMVAHSAADKVLTACSQCLHDALRIGAIKLRVNVVNAWVKVWIEHLNQDTGIPKDPQAVQHALLLLLSMIECGDESVRGSIPRSLLLSLLALVKRTRALTTEEQQIVERFIGCRHDRVVSDTMSGFVRRDSTVKRNSSIIGTWSRLPFALLWRNHALEFFNQGGIEYIIVALHSSPISELPTSLNTLAMSLRYCFDHAPPDSALMVLEKSEAIDRLLSVLHQNLKDIDDETSMHLLHIITTAYAMHDFHEVFFRSNGMTLMYSIMDNSTRLPKSTKQAVELLALLSRTMGVSITISSTFASAVSRARKLFLVVPTLEDSALSYTMVLDWICQIHIEHKQKIILDVGTVKDLMRVFRVQGINQRLVVVFCRLFGCLLNEPTIYQECIDIGIIQLICHALYKINGCDLELIQTLHSALMHTSKFVDIGQHVRVLQSSVQMWKESSARPRDFQTLVDSFELACYVITAYSRLKQHALVLSLNHDAMGHILDILHINLEDQQDRSFGRVLRCCLYVLETLHQSPFVTIATPSLDQMVSLVIQSIQVCVSTHHTNGFDYGTLIARGCTFIDRVLVIHEFAVECTVQAKWVEITHILLSRPIAQVPEREILFPVLHTLWMIMTSNPNFKKLLIHDEMLYILNEIIHRMKRDGMQTDDECLLLVLRTIEVCVWYPKHRSKEFVLQFLGAGIHQLLDLFVLSSSEIGREIVKRCIHITTALMTDSLILWLFQKAEQSITSTPRGSETLIFLRAVGVILFCDQSKSILTKLPIRHLIVHMGEWAKKHSFDREITGEVWNVLLIGNVLPEDDQEIVFNQTISNISSGLEITMGLLSWIQTVTDPEVRKRCQDALVDYIDNQTEELSLDSIPILCTALIALLRQGCEKTSEADSIFPMREVTTIWGALEIIVQNSISPDQENMKSLELRVTVIELYEALLQAVLPKSISSMPGCDLEDLVQFCLLTAEFCLRDASRSSILLKRVLLGTGKVLKHSILEQPDIARVILCHPVTTQHLAQFPPRNHFIRDEIIQWFFVSLAAQISSHGARFGVKMLKGMTRPAWTIVEALRKSSIISCGTLLSVAATVRWALLNDCVRMVSNFPGWEELTDMQHLECVHEEVDSLSNRLAINSGEPVDKFVEDTITRLSLVLLKWLDESQRPNFTLDEVRIVCSLLAQSMTSLISLYRVSTLFFTQDFSILAILHLEMAYRLVQISNHTTPLSSDSNETIQVTLLEFMTIMKGVALDRGVDGKVLVAYIYVACCIHLNLPFMKTVTGSTISFLEELPVILRALVHTNSFQCSFQHCLETCLGDLFTALAGVLSVHWEEIDTSLVVAIIDVVVMYELVSQCLIHAIVIEPHGIDILLDIAICSLETNVQDEIIIYLANQANHARLNRFDPGPENVQFVMNSIRRTVACNEDHISLQSARFRQVLESSLMVLTTFVRVKHCAIACANYQRMEILYNMMGSLYQDQSIVQMGLEICCCITSYSEAVMEENLFPLLNLLYLLVDTPHIGSAYMRLTFIIIQQCIATPLITFGLAQSLRSHLWKWQAQCATDIVKAEVQQVLKKLYAIQYPSIRSNDGERSDQDVYTTEELIERMKNEENAIVEAIQQHHKVVRCDSIVGNVTLNLDGNDIDVQSSVKSEGNALTEFLQLRNALCSFRDVLPYLDVVMNCSLLATTLPLLSEIVILHTSSTPDVVCMAIEIINRFSFLHPIDVLTHPNVDWSGFWTSCSVHVVKLLPCARFVASLCENVVLHVQKSAVTIAIPMVESVFTLLEHHYADLDVVQSSLFSLTELYKVIRLDHVIKMNATPLAVLNQVLHQHSHDVSIASNAIACLPHVLSMSKDPNLDHVTDLIGILINVVKVNQASHGFVVDAALRIIYRLYQEYKDMVTHQLYERDACDVLLCYLTMHVDDPVSVRIIVRLLLGVLKLKDIQDISMVHLLIKSNVHVILPPLFSRHLSYSDICCITLEVLLRLIEVEEDQPNDTMCHKQVIDQLFQDGILHLISDLFNYYASQSTSQKECRTIWGLIFEFLYDLTRDQDGRNHMDSGNGQCMLKSMIDIVWYRHQDDDLLEAALDCFVNLACSDHFLPGWNMVILGWFLELAESLHNKHVSSICLEKIMGILTQLAVHQEIGRVIVQSGAHVILQILSELDHDREIEISILILLWQLCYDHDNIALLIMFDTISIVYERIPNQMEDEELVFNSIRLLSTIAVEHDDCLAAFPRETIRTVLYAILDKMKQSQRIHHSVQELMSRLDIHEEIILRMQTQIKARASYVRDKEQSTKVDLPVQDIGAIYRERLKQGAVFRVRVNPKQKKREKMSVTLAEKGDYLIFRNLSEESTTLERVFVTQLEVVPYVEHRNKTFLNKLRSPSNAKCIFHLNVKQELMSLEASSPTQRQEWEAALQWLTTQPL